ncbi:hypothetical protein XcmpCFBP7700_17310 [Xanthomonas campestris]|nr:hypothetical protein XcmpCFBP7700_17310 [Xanthomonas campestris]
MHWLARNAAERPLAACLHAQLQMRQHAGNIDWNSARYRQQTWRATACLLTSPVIRRPPATATRMNR